MSIRADPLRTAADAGAALRPLPPRSRASQECTIVVVALNGGENLVECLDALLAQGASCLVMLPARTDSTKWRGRFPSIRFFEGAASVPVRRMQGIDAAVTEFVGLLEDSSVPGPQWLSALHAGFESDKVAAVGGPVTIGHDIGARQQALGCCEFGRYHPALLRAVDSGDGGARSFAVDRLPGNNLAYRRSSLRAVTGSRAALVETVVNAELRAAGFDLVLDPAMAVHYRPRGAGGVDWIDRYRHGRLYGSNRAAGRSVADRVCLLLKALLLPFVLSGRSLRWMTRAIPVRAWWKVGPLVCWLETAWAIGEATGTVAGVGGGIEGWTA